MEQSGDSTIILQWDYELVLLLTLSSVGIQHQAKNCLETITKNIGLNVDHSSGNNTEAVETTTVGFNIRKRKLSHSDDNSSITTLCSIVELSCVYATLAPQSV